MSLYGAVRPIVVGVPRVLWRVRLRHDGEVPARGACILAPSHRSMMDIPFLAAVTRRPIRFMGKQEAFDWPVVGPLFVKLGSFPVQRDGGDLGPLKESLAILTEGDALAVFPEGTRQLGPEIAELQAGAAYLAMRSGAPIVPVGIAGSEEIFRTDQAAGHPHKLPRLGRVAVVVGRPLAPPPRESRRAVRRADVDALSDRLRRELQQVFDEAYRVRDA